MTNTMRWVVADVAMAARKDLNNAAKVAVTTSVRIDHDGTRMMLGEREIDRKRQLSASVDAEIARRLPHYGKCIRGL